MSEISSTLLHSSMGHTKCDFCLNEVVSKHSPTGVVSLVTPSHGLLPSHGSLGGEICSLETVVKTISVNGEVFTGSTAVSAPATVGTVPKTVVAFPY